jgi:hypothetical protein
MAIAKIEPSGCTARKGKVQLRFSLYLEPGDPRYEEHHVKVDGEWRDNPFHNHFVYVDADATDAEIQRLLAESLEEFFGLWVKGVSILEAWKTRPLQSRRQFVPGDMSSRNTKKCQQRVKDIVRRAAEFQVEATNG